MYNAHVKTAYKQLANFSTNVGPRLLLDVSHRDVSTDAPTLRFDGKRLRDIGMELYPDNRWAWFAGDYALYCALLNNPNHSHIFMADYDVYINFSVDDLMTVVDRNGYDFVAPYAGFEDTQWMWTAAGAHWFERVIGCFFPIVILSRRLILRCLEVRLQHSRLVPSLASEKATFLENYWMNCEAFVPSVAARDGFSMMDIAKLVPGWTYQYFRDLDVLHWEMPEIASVPCAHPVFLKKDLPEQIAGKLRSLTDARKRGWFVSRVSELHRTDPDLWPAIMAASPEFADAPVTTEP